MTGTRSLVLAFLAVVVLAGCSSEGASASTNTAQGEQKAIQEQQQQVDKEASGG